MNLPLLHAALALMAMLLMAPSADAALAVNATRLVFDEGTRDKSLLLANTSQAPLLLQSWVDSGAGSLQDAQAPFVMVPSVVVIPPGGKSTVRVIYSGDPLPDDRESVFWMNLYQIPAKTRSDKQDPTVDLAMQLQMKLFYRPKALKAGADPVQLARQLDFSVHQQPGGATLSIHNPTPHFISLGTLSFERDGNSLGKIKDVDMMVPPFSRRDFKSEGFRPPATPLNLHYSIIGDGGHQFPFMQTVTPAPSQTGR